jgi:hypothetical protein
MNSNLGILSSDSLNKDGYVIAFSVLEQGIADNAIRGIPYLIDHDIHRPIGWIFPNGILIEPKISKTIGNFLLCENSNDYNLINPKIQNYWQYVNNESCKDYIDEFKTLLKDNYSSKGVFMDKGCVAYNLPNVVNKLFPNIFEKVDKSGLIYLDDILDKFNYIGDGIFKSKNDEFCLFCHQFFNRNLSIHNKFNTYFIDEFIKLNSNENITLRIAIDQNLIGLSKTHKGILEFDYWWGPKFNDDISNLPNAVTRYQSTEIQKYFNGIAGTEFWWKADKHEKTLEIEEIKETPSLGINVDSYGCRYIHSIYDTNNKEFSHFDGAIRLYSEEAILNRWNFDISKAGKDTDYTKLFRIDGKLELADWKKLCILYYKGNPLLFEYFGAKDEYENVKSSGSDSESTPKFFPYKVSPEDGIRLFVSYHRKDQEYEQFERKIINPDIITLENDTLSVLEYDIIEIEKYLKRAGGELCYPDDIQFVKPFDFTTNYPIILHGSNIPSNLIEETLKAFKFIFEKQNITLNKTISLTIGWEMDCFETRLSVFGKSSEIVKWLNLNKTIPTEHGEFKTWLEKQRNWIYENYEYSKKDYNYLLKADGVFYIKRKQIDREMISFSEDEDEYLIINPKGDTDIKTHLDNKDIHPSHLGLIKTVSCSKTKENYLTSTTSKYLDQGVNMVIEKIELLGFFWTDEPYY